MQEFTNGTFGPIEQADTLAQGIRADLKAIHFGSVHDLERLRRRKAKAQGDAKKRRRLTAKIDRLQEQIRNLETRINDATADKHTSGVRVYPATALAALGGH